MSSPGSAALGSCLLLLSLAPAAGAEPLPLAPGTLVQGEVTDPAVPVGYSFTAARGQTVFLDYRSSSNVNGLNWTLTDAVGRVLLSRLDALGDLGPATLLGGDYLLQVFSEGAGIGSFEFLVALGTPAPERAIVLGEEVAGELCVPGEQVAYGFEAVEGQPLYLELLSTSNAARLDWQLEDGLGRVLLPRTTELGHQGPFRLRAGRHVLRVLGEGDAVGAWQFRLLPVVDEHLPLALDAPVAGNVDSPGERHFLSFDASFGQAIFVDVLASANVAGLRWTLQDEAGNVLVPEGTSLVDAGPVDLLGGAYLLMVLPEPGVTATYELVVRTVFHEERALELGEEVTGQIAPGQRHDLLFAAAPGTAVTLDQLASSNGAVLNWTLTSAAGLTLLPRTTNLNDSGPLSLAGGEYRLRIEGEGAASASYTLRVVEVVDTVSPALVGGASLAGAIAVPGQRCQYTFAAAARQQLTLDLLQSTATAGLNWILTDAFGREVLPRTTSLNDVGPIPLLGGDYTLTVVGETVAQTGSFEFRLLDGGILPADSSPASPIVPGEAVAGAIALAGEVDLYRFTLDQPAWVLLDLTQSGAGLKWALADEVGGAVFSSSWATDPATHDQGAFLLAPGSYELTLTAAAAVPAYAFTVRLASDTVRLAGLGETVSGQIELPGDRHRYTVELAAPAEVYLDLLTGSSRLYWSLVDPVGREVFAPTLAATPTTHDQGPFALPAGRHTLTLDPRDDGTPAYSFRLVPVVRVVEPLALDVLAAGTIPSPGGSVTLSFALPQPARLYLDLVTGHADLRWTLRDPVGRALFESLAATLPADQDRGPLALGPGTYALELVARSGSTPDYALRLRHAAVTGPLALQVDEEVSGTFDTAGEDRSWELALDRPTRIYFDNRLAVADVHWTLSTPAGEEVFAGVVLDSLTTRDRGPYTLPAGIHTLRLENRTGGTPSYRFAVVGVQDRDGGEILLDRLVDGVIATSGARVRYRFTPASPGQPVTLDLLDSQGNLTCSLWDSVGQPLFADLNATNWSSHDRGPFPLVAGEYTLEFDGTADAVPGFRFRLVGPRSPASAPDGCAACRALEVAFLFDTSASMAAEAEAVCLLADELVQGLARSGIPVKPHFWGVHDQALIPCVTGTVRELFGTAVPGEPPAPLQLLDQCFDGGNGFQENTALATAIVAARHDWAPDAARLVVPVTDEGFYCGDPLTELDEAAILHASRIATEHAVVVSPLVPAGVSDPLIAEALTFAEGTQGTALVASFAPEELPALLLGLAWAACETAGDAARPQLVEVSPAAGATVAAPTHYLLSGRAVPVNPLRPVVGVLVDGEPVASLDAAGRFFHPLRSEPGENSLRIELVEECGSTFVTHILHGVAADALATASLVDVSDRLRLGLRHTSFVEGRRWLRFEARAELSAGPGEGPLVGPLLMTLEPRGQPTVRPVHPDGAGAEGESWWVLLPAGQTLLPGAAGPWVPVGLEDPELVPVRVAVRWRAPRDEPPRFVVAPRTEATVQREYQWQALAEDPEGHPVTYALRTGPPGMTIDPDSGVVLWTPELLALGNHQVAVAAGDDAGAATVLSWTLTVRGAAGNLPPRFTSLPPTSAAVGAAYRYPATAADPDADPLVFTLLVGPAGLTVAADGRCAWPFALPGRHEVALRVEDGEGGQAVQRFLLSVGEFADGQGGPLVTSIPPVLAAVGELYFYQPLVHEPDGDPLTFTLEEGPPGLELDPTTGRLLWLPGDDGVGPHGVRYAVADGRGARAEQGWVITVLAEPANLPPRILGLPGPLAAVGLPWSYAAQGVDPEGQPLIWSLTAAPAGMVVEPGTGLVQWTPGEGAVGTAPVALQAADPEGATASQVFLLDVRAGNGPPVITSTPPPTTRAGSRYLYLARATDPDGDRLRWSLIAGPAGLALDAALGLLSWQPALADVGAVPVTVRASDPLGAAADQSFTLEVQRDEQAPVVALLPEQRPACRDEPLAVCALATDDGSIVELGLTMAGAPVVLDAAGCADLLFPAVGVTTLQAHAVDWTGNRGEATLDLEVIDCNDRQAPVVTLVSPSPGARLEAPTPIVATITDDTPALLTWEVQIARAGREDFVSLATGAGPVEAGTVALFDTTVLANDSWRVRILASDGLQTGGVELLLGVGGWYKVGQLGFTLTDLLLPVAGLPLAITRHYSSLDTTPGDFGAGWRLGLGVEVTDSVAETDRSALGGLLGAEAFTRTTRVYVTRPDGERVGFTWAPLPAGFPLLTGVVPYFQPDPGVTDRLELVEPFVLLEIGGKTYQFVIPFNPDEYRFTTAAGVQYFIGEINGLKKIVDVHGNRIDVTPAGLVSSTGLALTFVRDAAGRIVRILEPAGPEGAAPPGELGYQYDGIGNLVLAVDASGARTEYFYEDPEHPHHLTRLVDPLGRPLVRNVYGDDGRLVAQCGPDGDPVTQVGCRTFTRDLAARTTTVIDARGNRRDRVFDAQGNVVLERRWLDALTSLDTTRVYDGEGHLLAETDPLGRTTRWTYDARGNPTSATLPCGSRWSFVNNDCDKVAELIDPQGNTTIYDWDESCLLVATIDPLGGLTEYLYDDRGRLTDRIDPVGGVLHLDYDAFGYVGRITDPGGGATLLVRNATGAVTALVDPRGRRIDYGLDGSQRVIRETWDTSPPQVFTFQLNAAGQITGVQGPERTLAIEYWNTGEIKHLGGSGLVDDPGLSLTYGRWQEGVLLPGYDANGNVVAVLDSRGGLTEYAYDALDRLTSIRQSGAGVREKRVDLVWDDASRVTELRRYADLQAARLVASTLREHGEGCGVAALRHRGPTGQPVASLELLRSPRGQILEARDGDGLRRYGYDGLGRLLAVEDGQGTLRERYRYDAIGNRLGSHRSAAYTYAYQAGGQGSALLADDGHAYAYDPAGNLIRRTHRGGEYEEYGYDHRQRLVTVHRRAANGDLQGSIRNEYDVFDRRVAVTVDGQTTHVLFDRQNPVLDLTDGLLRRRLYGDALDDLLAFEDPAGIRWPLVDQRGAVTDLLDDAGDVLAHHAYDSFGNLAAGAAGTELSGGYLFGGRPRLPGLNLDDFRYRTYDPELGRFTQLDRLPPFDYLFASNDPLHRIDPMGLNDAPEEGILSSISSAFSKAASKARCAFGIAGIAIAVAGGIAPEGSALGLAASGITEATQLRRDLEAATSCVLPGPSTGGGL
ncbi:MAG: putative Ig domain-containing protein [Myxococcota bacterium]|jgi:RHS repeat-associated protein|nr:putative Ig domain-containing protein [Myxococcota bacterium]